MADRSSSASSRCYAAPSDGLSYPDPRRAWCYLAIPAPHLERSNFPPGSRAIASRFSLPFWGKLETRIDLLFPLESRWRSTLGPVRADGRLGFLWLRASLGWWPLVWQLPRADYRTANPGTRSETMRNLFASDLYGSLGSEATPSTHSLSQIADLERRDGCRMHGA